MALRAPSSLCLHWLIIGVLMTSGACGTEEIAGASATGVDAGVPDTSAPPEDAGTFADTPGSDDSGSPEDTTPPADATPTDVGPVDVEVNEIAPEDATGETLDEDVAGEGVGVDAAEEDIQEEDVSPPPAIPTEPQEQGADVLWQVTPVPLSDVPMVFAAPMSGDQVLCQDADGLPWRVAPSVLPYPLPDLPGALSDVAMIDGFPLVTSDQGIYVIELDKLVLPSPLGTLFEGDPIGDLLLVEDGPMAGLWLSADSGLWVHQDGSLYDVDTPEVAVTDPAMAFGAVVNDVPAVWVGAEDRVVALVPEPGDDVEMAAWVTDLPATDLAVDGEGILWVISDGELFRRAPDGTWQWRTFEAPVTALSATEGPGLWFTVGQDLWYHEDGVFGPTEDGFTGALLGGDDDGRALVTRDDGLWRLVVGDEPVPPPVVPPTWTDDIEPLYVEACSLCHSATGSANLKLHEREHWVTEIEKILTMVSLGSMPLPPIPLLDPVEIQMIEDWELAGFPE